MTFNPIRGVIGIFVNINNYIYTVKCFKLFKDYPQLWNPLNLAISPIGILYSKVELDKEIIDKHPQILTNMFQPLDDALVGMDLYGLVTGKKVTLGENDNNKIVYLIKYAPMMEHITIFNFFKLFVILYITYRLCIKYDVLARMIDILDTFKNTVL